MFLIFFKILLCFTTLLGFPCLNKHVIYNYVIIDIVNLAMEHSMSLTILMPVCDTQADSICLKPAFMEALNK